VVLIEHDKEAGRCRLVREPQDLADKIATLLGEGLLQKDIAKELGLSESKVSRIVTRDIRPA
jgi:uncharacterized membrane protein